MTDTAPSFAREDKRVQKTSGGQKYQGNGVSVCRLFCCSETEEKEIGNHESNEM